jgi:hypothetical protein
LSSLRVGSIANLVYGAGAAKLSLTVGGNLTLNGNSIPSNQSSAAGSWAWADFGRGMASFGLEMGKFGLELGQTLGTAFKSADIHSRPRYERPRQQREGDHFSQQQKREAILRMVAEGRITVEEGNMLLEGLGQ